MSDQARLAEIEAGAELAKRDGVWAAEPRAVAIVMLELLAALRAAERQRDEAAAAIRACILDAEGQEAVTADKGLELTKGQVQILHRGLLAASRGVEGELLRGGFAGSDASGSVEVGADAVAAAERRAEDIGKRYDDLRGAYARLSTESSRTISSLQAALASEREAT